MVDFHRHVGDGLRGACMSGHAVYKQQEVVMNFEVSDALNGYAKVTRSVGVLVKLLDAANDNVEIATGDFADILEIIYERLKRQEDLLEKLTS